MRGSRLRYCGSIRSSQRLGGSFTWQSAETIKYLFGAPGVATRGQPSWPGVYVRCSGTSAVVMEILLCCAERCHLPGATRTSLTHLLGKQAERLRPVEVEIGRVQLAICRQLQHVHVLGVEPLVRPAADAHP